MIQLRSHFRGADRRQLQEWRRQQKHLEHFRRENQERKSEATAEEVESDLLSAVMNAVLATSEEIEAFTVKLDAFENRLETYDKAVVAALMQKQAELEKISKRLEKVREEMGEMRKDVFVMEDGRHIFLNTDGTKAIDISGKNVPIKEVPVESIPPRARIADRYLDRMQEESDLVNAQTDIENKIESIHSFDKLRRQSVDRHDEIRTEIEKGDITKEQLEELDDELDQMDKDLLQLMPPSVRENVPDLKLDADKPDVKAAFTEQAVRRNMQPAISQSAGASATPDLQPGA